MLTVAFAALTGINFVMNMVSSYYFKKQINTVLRHVWNIEEDVSQLLDIRQISNKLDLEANEKLNLLLESLKKMFFGQQEELKVLAEQLWDVRLNNIKLSEDVKDMERELAKKEDERVGMEDTQRSYEEHLEEYRSLQKVFITRFAALQDRYNILEEKYATLQSQVEGTVDIWYSAESSMEQ